MTPFEVLIFENLTNICNKADNLVGYMKSGQKLGIAMNPMTRNYIFKQCKYNDASDNSADIARIETRNRHIYPVIDDRTLIGYCMKLCVIQEIDLPED